jgi:spermidine synthase
MKKVYYLNAINFLAAFLLFQIELIVAKIFLPKFGGSYLVWGACVVFFQCTLLFGYLYSHLAVQKLGIFRYRRLHVILLLLPLLSFPGRPLTKIFFHQNVPMVMDVFWQLAVSVGLVFFVLSTTSIIFQSWLSASRLPERSNPYVLYAVSNIGSFLALLSYPFFFEAYFDLDMQLNIWRACYGVLLALHFIAFKSIEVDDTPQEEPSAEASAVSEREKISWFLFAAGGAIAFLSVTNIITYEIAPVPLLWIIPLCIYLISFVLNFKERIYCPEWIKNKFHLTVAFSVLLFFLSEKRTLPLLLYIGGFYMSLYIVCMFCQNELVKSKPKGPKDLTLFYLIISTGSFIGGFLVSWVIPLVCATMIEYLLSFVVIYCALALKEGEAKVRLYDFRLIFYSGLLLMLWPCVFRNYNFLGMVIIFSMFKYIYSELKRTQRAMCFNLIFVLCVSPSFVSLWASRDYLFARRNYYGIYEIFDDQGLRVLVNGTTGHGGQYLLAEKQMQPLMYYHRKTPVGKLMESKLYDFHTVGIIGLGVGTLAAYGKEGQKMDFFELDRDVFFIANRYFTYLKNSRAKINYIFGDARIELSKVPRNRYDLLVMDAFSGDSVPMHLLTTNAMSEYKNRITQSGIILFHISNRYIDLVPVLFSNAKKAGAYVAVNANLKKASEAGVFPSIWSVVTWDPDTFNTLTTKLEWKASLSPTVPVKPLRPWTDTYSSILPLLKLESFLDSIKEFRPFYW